MCPHASWVPILAVFLILLAVSILAAHPSIALCTGCGVPHWLWTTMPALTLCGLCIPALAVPLYQQCPHGSHFAALGERGHPCKCRVLSLREAGLTATHKLLGRERG